MLYAPDAAARAALAAALEVPEVRKLRLEGRLRPEGKRDWRLEATLGATVIQTCVVTLAPVTTRIDEPLTRRYLAHVPDPAPEPGAEVEMPDDVDIEPLPESIDLAQVALEALALALPAYPRAEGVEAEEVAVTEPGKTPMTDDDARPFAGLAGLRDRLAGDDGEER